MKQKKLNIKLDIDYVALKWIEENLNTIQKIYIDKAKFENFLFKKIEFGNKEWFDVFKKEIKSIKEPVKKLQFIYDLYLAFQGLDIEYPEGETKNQFRKIKNLKY